VRRGRRHRISPPERGPEAVRFVQVAVVVRHELHFPSDADPDLMHGFLRLPQGVVMAGFARSEFRPMLGGASNGPPRPTP
jgi:hypothetical protein